MYNRRRSTTRRSRSRRDSTARQRIPRWVGWAAIAMLAVIALTAVYFQFSNPPIVNTLPAESSPAQALELVRQGAIIIDVRDPDWFAQYRIPGSLSIPYDQLTQNLAAIPRGVNLVVVDDLGDKGGPARDLLLRKGFTAVTAITGGITGWIEKGLPVEGTFPY